MNHIYRLVFEAATGQWKAVGECVRGRGKAGRVCDGRVLAALVLVAGSALAAPQGGGVSAGSGSISVNGATTTITQTSPKLSLNWQSFSVGTNETVNFQQPSASAVALNRVLGAEGSQILGSINANGQVFLLNPNGVLFGKDAQVNVGGLVASTLKLSDADFLAGRYTFIGSTGSIVNQGSLNAAPSGYIALLAPEVRNEGTIRTPQGTTLLAAGDKVTLSLDNGLLLGYQIDAGSFNALVENKALIQAEGGRVYLAAKAAATELAKAVVNHEGVIEARTLQDKGGVIQLMGDMQKGEVKVAGTLDASAPNGGNGGFIETSAAKVKVANSARITTKAASGKTGTWLIDPQDYTIAAAGGDITGADLSAQLANTNVTIQSIDGATEGNGDIFVNDGVTWNANTLTLNAQRNITVNSAMNGSGTAGLALEYGQGAAAAGNTASYSIKAPVNLASTGSFSTRLGSDGAVKNYTIVTSLGTETSSNDGTLQGIRGNLSGNFVLGANIDASATSTWNAGAGFTPIGGNGSSSTRYAGIFDGLGHVVDMLKIDRPTTAYIGLFGSTSTASILRNVGLTQASVKGNSFVGALAGTFSGKLEQSYATGSVSASMFAGGLLGRSNDATIARTYANVTTQTVNEGAGGLIGVAFFSTISDSYAMGDVTASERGGGLIGRISATSVARSYATGRVTVPNPGPPSPYWAGGLIGMENADLDVNTITDSYWSLDSSGQTAGVGTRAAQGTFTVTGLTTAQMKDPFTFLNGGWDFATTWGKSQAGNNAGYMVLKSLDATTYQDYVRLTAPSLQRVYRDGTLATPTGISVDNVGLGFGNVSVGWGSAITNSTSAGVYAYSSPNVLAVTNTAGRSTYVDYGTGALTIQPVPIASVSGITARDKSYDALPHAQLLAVPAPQMRDLPPLPTMQLSVVDGGLRMPEQ